MVKKKKTEKQKKRKSKLPFSLKKKTRKIIRDTFIWVAIFALITVVVVPAGFSFYFHKRIYPHILVGPYNLSGKTYQEGLFILENNYSDPFSYQFQFLFEEQNWSFSGQELGMKIDLKQTIDQAYDIGRSPSILTNLKMLVKSQKETIKIPLEITFDPLVFASASAQLEEQVNIPLIEPSIMLVGGKAVVVEGVKGQQLNQSQLQERIKQTVTDKLSLAINLPVIYLNPSVSQQEGKETEKRANNLLSKELKLIIGDADYDLKNEELISLIGFKGSFNTEKIASLTANLAQAYDKNPQNAVFNFENGRVTVFKPGKDGQTLNQEEGKTMLLENLLSLEATSSSSLTTNLPIKITPPEISTAEVNDLGIRELLGQGISYFRGSIASRVHNIVLASSKLNGLLIKPKEVFSFNQALGEVSLATGYQQAYIIENGRTVLGDGGGVCQVSTTFFRAALNSGLPIIERRAHAYRVAYYEQGFGAGLDATVFSPSVDLKVENNTPAHILIQTKAYPQTSTLIFEFYGSSDGRKAFISAPKIWDQVAPPPDKYEDDPTLPQGTVKQVDWAAWGAKASFDYKVTRGDEVLIKKTFYSNYRPWQAVYLRGTAP